MAVSERFVAFTSADTGAAAVAGDAWVTLDFGSTENMSVPAADRRRKVVLYRVHVLRTGGGSATAHTALVADVTGSIAAAWATKYESAAVAAASRLDETGLDAPMYTDTEGKLFFTPGGAAADTFAYEVWAKAVP